MTTELSTRYPLPPLRDGRRYFHELQDPNPVPPENRRVVLDLLHKFYEAVSANAPTLSEASGTSVAARSERSIGTSMTDMTSAFSANNEPVQQEPAKKPLGEVQRTRKALLRKLRACREDCRRRKVKCPLWHHALRDLLEIEHTAYDEEVVEWAIRYDAELQTPVVTAPVSARLTRFATGNDVEERNVIVNQVNGVFDLDPRIPMLYGPGELDITAPFLHESERVSSQPFTGRDIVIPDSPTSDIYGTDRQNLMYQLGSRAPMIQPAHYSCWFGDCVQILPLQELISHFQGHLSFEPLDDPLRMVCPICDKFYSFSTDECRGCAITSGELVERVYGYFPDLDTPSPQPGGVAIESGYSSFGSPVPQGSGESSYHDPNSNLWNDNYYSNNDYYGSYGNLGFSYYSYAKSILGNFIRKLVSTPITSLRLISAVIRRRKYVTTLVIAAIVSLIFGYKKHRWLVSNLIQLTRGVSMASPSKLPLICVIIASVAFALHRIVVHATRANSIRSGWLSRCAIKAFNVACGRRRPEWSGTTGYELGHSRS